jgi:pilus assembly protein CpaE
MHKNLVLVVDDSATIRKVVGSRLAAGGFEVKLAASAEEALLALQSLTPDLIISDVSMTGMSGYDLTRKVRATPSAAQVPILLLTSFSGVTQKVAGFEAGADDYLTKPFDPAELDMRVRALLKRRGSQVDSAPSAYTIAFFSLRGGLGQTTLAVNTALKLARLTSEQVALLDLAAPVGQTAVMLNVGPTHTLADLADHSLEAIDEDLVTALMRRFDSGVNWITASAKPADTDCITGNLVTTLLPIVSARYRYSVIDVPHDFGEVSLACLDAATTIVMLLAPDLVSVRAAALTLETFEALGYPAEKTFLAMNWVFRKGGLPQKDIEAALKRPIDLVIPHEPDLLTEAINRGIPVSTGRPDSGVARVFEQLARQAGQLQMAEVRERVKA